MNEPFKYDVFLSYGAHDRGAARALAERFERDGLRVWPGVFDDDAPVETDDAGGARGADEANQTNPIGEAARRAQAAGLEQARTLVLLLSRHATAAEWVTFEQHAVRFRDPLQPLRRLLPVRLDDAAMRDALKPFALVDWRQRSEEQYSRLLAACRPVANELGRVTEQKDQATTSKVFKGHTERVWGVVVTPDGQRVISGSADKTLRVWELDSGRCLATLKGHSGEVWGVAVTPDGRRVVSGSRDTTIRVWEIDSGKCLATLEGYADAVGGVAITPNGQYIVSGSADNTLQIWDIKTEETPLSLKGMLMVS